MKNLFKVLAISTVVVLSTAKVEAAKPAPAQPVQMSLADLVQMKIKEVNLLTALPIDQQTIKATGLVSSLTQAKLELAYYHSQTAPDLQAKIVTATQKIDDYLAKLIMLMMLNHQHQLQQLLLQQQYDLKQMQLMHKQQMQKIAQQQAQQQ